MYEIKLNLGAGNRLVPHAIHHDLTMHRPEISVVHDLNILPWPFSDESFDRIEAWSVFEHLECDLVETMAECWRIMKPGGILNIKLPSWKHKRSWRDPTHRWRIAWETYDLWDPLTEYGGDYEFYVPRKWEVLNKYFNDESKSGICAKMRKIMDDEQWEETLGRRKKAIIWPGRIYWFTGPCGAGKSTIARAMKLVYPCSVLLDDHDMWRSVWDRMTPSIDHVQFSKQLAYLARQIASQGNMVFVSIVTSPHHIRLGIDKICKPYWVYVKRENKTKGMPYKGKKLPEYDKPPEGWPNMVIDNDLLTKGQAIRKMLKRVNRLRTEDHLAKRKAEQLREEKRKAKEEAMKE